MKVICHYFLLAYLYWRSLLSIYTWKLMMVGRIGCLGNAPPKRGAGFIGPHRTMTRVSTGPSVLGAGGVLWRTLLGEYAGLVGLYGIVTRVPARVPYTECRWCATRLALLGGVKILQRSESYKTSYIGRWWHLAAHYLDRACPCEGYGADGTLLPFCRMS